MGVTPSMRTAGLLVMLSCVAVGTYACSSSSGGAKSTGCTAGCSEGGAVEGGPAEGGGGGGDAAGESGGHDAGPSQQFVGGVSLDKLGTLYNMTALFYPVPDAGVSSACPGTQMGACCYRPPNGSVPTYTYASAGTLTIQAGGSTVSTVMPDMKNIYSATSANGGSLSWNAGDMVSAAASGDTVSAFTAQIVAPDDITSTTPNLSQPVTISTQSDFSLSWATATQSGATMEVVLSDEKTYGSIACNVMDSVASVVVPKALLANFTAGDTGRVALTRVNGTTFAMGNVQGTISVSTVGPTPSATFQ